MWCLRNRKHVPCFYRVIQTRVGEREMLWKHELQASVSTAFSSSPKLSRVYNSIETRSICFLFLLEKTRREKGKQLVNFDY